VDRKPVHVDPVSTLGQGLCQRGLLHQGIHPRESTRERQSVRVSERARERERERERQRQRERHRDSLYTAILSALLAKDFVNGAFYTKASTPERESTRERQSVRVSERERERESERETDIDRGRDIETACTPRSSQHSWRRTLSTGRSTPRHPPHSCITQLKAHGPSRTCIESTEEEEEYPPLYTAMLSALLAKDFVNRAFDTKVSFFFYTLVTGPRGSLSLKLSDTRVYEPQKRSLPKYPPQAVKAILKACLAPRRAQRTC